ncbi:2-C-methyl-D-erythritol 2,4-cyclodiphosphate synthase [Thioflexithrix psekupsensis]|uniref:2-C-methyl-D-erythritol 2,4-cyclodiphosphate synthase n=1 Tax=Thioflexithrix psekupsensis TaxID=1570016 RepID=A0A251X7S0_9GAMM|nr:2-C-methyl-D-erythritol 2,4-cyclodiphosphate synthase [Thioflexithrix psekupsensis]OUD13834.1 2-C-methyl-D-erythritol 2,4-cyclodiphosphate synthase [Thioflexithrix psekupsensis]
MRIKTAIGQDSHGFEYADGDKPLVLGGVIFERERGLEGNSDADVMLHALTNAISGITGVNILGKISDDLCQQGMTDSRVYLAEALKYLNGWQICHASFSIECAQPKISPKIPELKASLSQLLQLTVDDIGITATSGEDLTAFGRGEGIQVFCIVTAVFPMQN